MPSIRIHPFFINMKDFLLSIVRRAVRFKVNPVRDLALSGATPFDWTSTGDHPVFDLEPEGKGKVVPSGWVYVESRMIRRGACLVARLYVDTGSGFSDLESFVIPAARSGNIKQIIKIPRNTRRLHLSPMRGEGAIRLDFIRITKISNIERVARMAEWVIGDIIKFRDTGRAKKYNVTWRRLLTDLSGAYVDCAKLRFHSVPLDYGSYVEKFDVLRQSDIISIRRHIDSFKKRPLISILIQVRRASLEYIESTIRSILTQIYESWELCIAVDGVDVSEVAGFLKSIAEKDARVKIVFMNSGGYASVAANAALDLATGEFSTILGQNDVLSSHALYLIALKVNEVDDLNIIYSDDDEIDECGIRGNVRFKSSWNPDLFFSCDMISRSAAYRTSLLRKIGGFRIEYEGGQDIDLALRCVKNSKPSQICHIPRVLFHLRQFGESGVTVASAEGDVCSAKERALSDFFKGQSGVKVSRGEFAGTYRVRYPIPAPTPKVTIIIPTRDGGPLLKKCIFSVFDGTVYENLEVVVVDNQSKDQETVDFLKSLSLRENITVLKYDFPFNYSSINNFAERHASGDVLCFLNDDVEAVEPDWLKEMVSHALRPDIGAVGAKLLYADGFVQHAGVVMGIGGFASHAHRLYPSAHPGYAGRAALVQNFSAVTGACLVMRREVFREVGGFDEENLPVAFNDVDLCLRVREAGYRVVWTPYAVLHHFESYSRGDDQMSAEKRARFNREKRFMLSRWKTDQLDDPYYNQNLTLDREDFTIADFPRMYAPWSASAA
ncbi:glycosyltransferase family 2 protein [Burkholderia cenocepacia]|uniref:glycosyltransferase family 2 protein n=1 Tax=Burkholderia cenocepacia TaxID=95486 RepID=UPI0020128C52|nr:glycosyltransferase family 2 protein [Burkholderia cenocepacia]MDA3666785.1 glycosyltransferase family 2 protein [Burkholderia cenocepacia]MDA3676509.1 glycosyltransferase family 2 protein [Burkholderia cenocepacia]MDA3689156.1 glycosyltransferase family 2 protein [Burkholderia cenocepacia]MDA3698892.1 glycosyltransferase family 2 protein [Burkholderia cenocepacia]MDA3710482.1 glycosyltransferase family 2 protein [Burkholderia cenocepacia]